MTKRNKMKIYLICPARNSNEDQKNELDRYVQNQESCGNVVFYPYRDAPQESKTGYEIVESELRQIKECDEVHVYWDVNSIGSHFDLGMAYALRKVIKIINAPSAER